MVSNKLTKNGKGIWSITIHSNYILSNKNKDLIATLIDAECHNSIKRNHFILHDILETKKSSNVIFEGNKLAVINLLSMLKSDLPYGILYNGI